ncbi:MAG: leucine-rich repeat domain-containing protein, partial [bacterium]
MTNDELLQRIEQVATNEKVKGLDLSGLELTALPSEIGQLANLLRLNLSNNRLTTLPQEIGQLTNLMELYLHKNQLTTLPPEIGKLTNLSLLYIDKNELNSLPEEIGQLFNLRALYLYENKLNTLIPEICQLTNLTRLLLGNNKLTALPREIDQLINLKYLDLTENPLPIPPEILAKTDEPTTIINYYLQYLTGRKKLLNEAKVLLVGQGSVGKTSLVKRLVKREYDQYENKTEGISITQWQITVNGQNIRLNVWDFGGQEIMHATHQFFLTKRSLYLLVLNAREGEQDANVEYWLRLIESFGGDSPVLVVINQIKQHPFDLNRRGFQAKFPAVRGFIQTDCEAEIGLDELRQAV